MVDDSTPLLVGGRYRVDRDSPLDGPLTAWFGRDEILERPVLVIDVTATAAASGCKDVPAVLDAARRAALISDRRLVKLLDVSQDSELAYIVTEEPGGRSVAAAGSPALSAQQGRALLGELATALEVASGRGVHHLDINADSVFFTPSGPRLLGAGFAAALLARPMPQDEDAALFDTDQVRTFVRGMVSDEELATDSTLADVLDAGRVFVRPAQVAARLDPWDVESLASLAPGQDSTTDGESAAGADEAVAGAAVSPSRTSARSRFSPNDELSPPGTPPPASPSQVTGLRGGTGATPVRVATGVAAGTAATGLAGAGASLLAPVLPVAPAAPAAPVFAPVSGAAAGAGAAGGAHGSVSGAVSGAFGSVDGPPIGRPGGAPVSLSKRLQVSSTFVVLLLIIGLIATGGIWAALTIGANLEPTHEVLAVQDGGTKVTPAPSDSTDSGSGSTSTQSRVLPTIKKSDVVALDPDGDGDEHPELLDRAVDDDQQTFWTSRTYKYSNFGGYDRSGIGFGIPLEEPAEVSAVFIISESKGGTYELRSTSFDEPGGGELLATGKFEEDMEIAFDEPVTTESLVLWVTDLPAVENGFAITINEISLS